MSIIVPSNHTRIGAWVNSKMSGRNPGACHYLTNRFQMEAPVAPSRSLREASVGMAEAFAKPSRSLLGGFSKPSAPATSS